MKNRYIKQILTFLSVIMLGQAAWGQTDSSLTQVLCFGTTAQPYCVDCSSNAGAGLGGSTYYWQITTAGFSGSLYDDPAFIGSDSTNHILIDWGTTPPGPYSLSVTEYNASGCIGLPRVLSIQINPLNTASTPAAATTCVNAALTPITITTTGATGIGIPSGLPAGVTATWANNTITISGVPTAAGSFNYSIPLTGGCGTVNATGSITVTDINTTSTPAPVTTCIDVALAPSITISTTGATGIGAATNLPAGLSASFSGDANAGTITISGTPTAAGSFNYSIPLTGGCGTVNATGSITVNPINTASTPAPVTTCIDVALASSITISTTGATGIGTATGLPAGVTASFSGDATAGTITISGTPTAAGSFNYSIPLTGGCGTVNATGSITVNPINTASTPAPVTACINVALAPSITISTTGATGIGTATGLPAGLSASFSGDATAGTITIIGTPTAAGSFNYSIPLTGGCGTVNATGSITITQENTVTGPTPTPNFCINEQLSTTVTFNTTGATGIGAAIGLPAGLTASFSGTASAGTITIIGTPTIAGSFIYSIPLTGGCGNVSATGTLNVNQPIVTSPIFHN